jgi:hypothetical protein
MHKHLWRLDASWPVSNPLLPVATSDQTLGAFIYALRNAAAMRLSLHPKLGTCYIHDRSQGCASTRRASFGEPHRTLSLGMGRNNNARVGSAVEEMQCTIGIMGQTRTFSDY